MVATGRGIIFAAAPEGRMRAAALCQPGGFSPPGRHIETVVPPQNISGRLFFEAAADIMGRGFAAPI